MALSCSIVIPTRNNAKTLGCLLSSIRSQTYSPIETLVADGGSTDGTRRIALENGATVIPVSAEGDSRCVARNLAARHSSGKVLFFIDSDMELGPEVVGACVKKIQEGGDAVVIPEVTLGKGVVGAIRRWERTAIQEDLRLVFPRAIRTDVFWKVGGFDEKLVGFEDLDLEASLLESDARIATITASIFHHEEDVRMGEYLRKRRYYLGAASKFRSKHPRIASGMFSPLDRLKLYVSGIQGFQDLPWMVMATILRAREIL